MKGEEGKGLKMWVLKKKFSEVVAQRCSVKIVFLKMSQNSRLQIEDCNFVKTDCRRCFAVNIAKFLRTPPVANSEFSA